MRNSQMTWGFFWITIESRKISRPFIEKETLTEFPSGTEETVYWIPVVTTMICSLLGQKSLASLEYLADVAWQVPSIPIGQKIIIYQTSLTRYGEPKIMLYIVV